MIKLKTMLLILAAAVCGSSARADVFDNPDNHAYVGARAAFELMCPTQVNPNRAKIDKYDMGPGVAIGAVCYVPLWKNLYFEPGPQFYYNHIKYSATKESEYTGKTIMEYPISRVGLRIPFAFGYRFDFQPCAVSVFTGPVLDFCFAGRYTSTVIVGSIENDIATKGKFTSTGFAWKFGAGVNIRRFVVELSGTLGTTSSFKKGPNTFRNSYVTLTLGYNFTK